MSNSRTVLEEIEPTLDRKSNSEEEESNETVEEVPDYVDKAGRRWHFLCHAKEEDLAQFVQQNGLVPGNENGKRRKFGCSRPECHFRAVFLKANSGIYTRGEHWHEQMDGSEANLSKNNETKASGDIPKSTDERSVCSLTSLSKIVSQGNQEIFIGSNRKEFKLVCRFETDDEFEKYRERNWLMKTGGVYKDRIYLSCRRRLNLTKISTNCRVFAIYAKDNRSLYRNSKQHNHPMVKENELYFSRFLLKFADDKKADFVDHTGQCWHFLRKIDTFEELEKFAKKQMLYININRKRLFYFKCKYVTNIKKLPYPPPYCQMRAIFIKATSSVYVRNEHSNHPNFKMKSRNRHGKLYRELSNFFEAKNAEKKWQEVPTPKEEADSEEDGTDHGEEVRILKHLQRDYKCLGRMKREGDEEGQNRIRTDMDLPVHTIHMEEEEGTSQATRKIYRYPQRELQQ